MPLLNNPRDPAASWFPNPFGGEAFPETPPPLAPGLLPDVDISQFRNYLGRQAVQYEYFQAARAEGGPASKLDTASGRHFCGSTKRITLRTFGRRAAWPASSVRYQVGKLLRTSQRGEKTVPGQYSDSRAR